MSPHRIPLAAAAAVLIGLLSPLPAAAQAIANGRAAQDGGDGQQAAADPDGKVRAPTADERRALAEQRRAERDAAPAAEPKATRRANGTLHAEVPEHLESVSVAKVENGRVVTGCFESRAEADAFLNGAGAAKPEEK